MGHQLTIEGDDAYAMASELAALTGESLASAVTQALRARLDEERRKRDQAAREASSREERIARVKAITARARAGMKHPLPSLDHSDLYGEDGLPA